MKKAQLILGIISLLLAALIFLLDAGKIAFLAGSTNVTIYPAIVLTVLGVILIAISRKPTEKTL